MSDAKLGYMLGNIVGFIIGYFVISYIIRFIKEIYISQREVFYGQAIGFGSGYEKRIKESKE